MNKKDALFSNMFPILKRLVSWAVKEISRNKGMFSSTLFVLIISTTLVGSLFLLKGATDFVVDLLENKADITVFFNENATDDEIAKVQEQLSKIPQVKDVKYVSKEEALSSFKEKHKDDPDILKSLEEVGSNPFLPHLDVKAWKASQYEQITNFINMSPAKDVVEKIDYYQNKSLINRIFSISRNIKVFYAFLILISTILAVSVTFSAVRLAIYDSREEISIMRLVGASNWFIRGPFAIQGIILGIISAIISLAILGIMAYLLTPKIAFFAPGFNLAQYFKVHFLGLLSIEFLFSIILSTVLNLIAVRRYLKI